MSNPQQRIVPFAQAVYLNDILVCENVLLGECSLSQIWEYFQFTHEERIPVIKHRTTLVTLLIPHEEAESLCTQLNTSLVEAVDGHRRPCFVTCRIESDQYQQPFIATGYSTSFCRIQQDHINTHISFHLEHRIPA